MKILFLIFSFSIPLLLKAQNNHFELITDRPDQTESSTLVPEKTLQIETGFVLETDETKLFNQKSFTYNTTLLRFGLIENFELRLGLEFLGEEIENKHSDSINTNLGLSPMYAGFKVKIAEEDGRKPEIAFIGGLVLPFTANDYFKPEYSAANVRFSFAHTLSERFSIGYNLGAEWDGESAAPGYFYSLAIGVEVSNKLGMFFESYGLLQEERNDEHMLDAGFTYLLLPNLQLDISVGIGIIETAVDNFISFGLSYRVPN